MGIGLFGVGLYKEGRQELLTGIMCLCISPLAPKTKFYKLGGLKQQQGIASQFWGPEGSVSRAMRPPGEDPSCLF